MDHRKTTNYNIQTETILQNMPASDFFSFLEQASAEQLYSLSAIETASTAPIRATAPFHNLLEGKHHASLPSMLQWWEARRPFYNLIVALCGLPALFLISAYSHVSAIEVISSVCSYAVCANVCYTLGLPLELMAWMRWRQGSSHVGPLLYTAGTFLSAMVTLGISWIIFTGMLVYRF